MKRILPEFEFSEEQLNQVRLLAKECNLCEETVKILYGRGVRDKSAIDVFMHPSKSHFISPFKMRGMQEAVELIRQARDEEWSVVVFGDYDADGICASTIMGNALRDFGIEPVVIVPERNNGYGLSKSLIDEIFDEYFPQLFITVDCGISCADEVEYLKESGALVIITDHHELPDKIPDCVCINPKFNDGYPYDNLCGAGVAFKVGCALNGESAYKYLDFAAIATVADSVPLTGENRDIVHEGLKIIRDNPAKCYRQFLNKTDSITAQTLAFTLAPKINAAGRMGDAKAALALFNETDDGKIFDLSAKLTAYNMERQKCCDELYLSAKEMIKERGSVGKIILLCNESWNSGFVGIVAARLADEFSRPAILFVKNGNMLKGSARSVESVNIFEALKACSSYLTEFGGHSQAAGVNVSEENFEALYDALEKYMTEKYTDEDFIPTVFVNGSIDSFSPRLVKEMELLEPYGVGNRRPMFTAEALSLPARPLKPFSQHLTIKNQKIEFMCFGGAKFARILESNAPKKLIFEYNVSTFKGKEYVKGFVRDVIYGNDALKHAEEEIAFSLLETLSKDETGLKLSTVTRSEAEECMRRKDAGCVFLTWDCSAYKTYGRENNLNCDMFFPSLKSFSSQILAAPTADADLSGFKRVIILDNTYCATRIPSLAGGSAQIVQGASVSRAILGLNTDRNNLLTIFAQIVANSENLEGTTCEEVARRNSLGDKLQVFFALKVFEQLGLVNFEKGKLEVIRGIKSKLENSPLYNLVSKIKAE